MNLPRTWPAWLAALLAFAAFARLDGLGEIPPLGDEYLQFYLAARPEGLREFLAAVRGNPHHVLVDPLSTYLMAQSAGLGRFWLRLPSLLWALAGVGGTWALGQRVLGWPGGPAAAFLLCLSAMHIEWSRHANFYALSAALSAWQSVAFLRMHRGPGRWRPYACCAAVFCLAHPYAMLLGLVHGVFLAAASQGAQRRRLAKEFALAWGLAGLAALPWFIFSAHRLLQDAGFWGSPGTPTLRSFLWSLPWDLAMRSEVAAPRSPWGRVVVDGWGPVYAALFLASSWAARKRPAGDSLRLCHLALGLGIPLVVLADFAFGLYLVPRQALWLEPFYLVAVAHGAGVLGEAMLKRAWGARAGAAACAVAVMAWGPLYRETTRALKELGRGQERLVETIAARARTGDCFVFASDLLAHSFLFHYDLEAFRSLPAFRGIPKGLKARRGGVEVWIRLRETDEAAGSGKPGEWSFDGSMHDLRVRIPERGRGNAS